MPQISIIIPVYNAESFLDETLGSVLCQTMTDIEIICVDDCSTDASFSILEKYADADSRIKLIRFDTNQSAAQARKSGVMAATGEYILFQRVNSYFLLLKHPLSTSSPCRNPL